MLCDDVEVDDEVEREFEGKAEGSMVELEKKNGRKDRPHTGRGNPENEIVNTKMF